MGDAVLAFEDPDPLHVAPRDSEVVEEPPLAQQDRDEMDLEFVEDMDVDNTVDEMDWLHVYTWTAI